MKPTDILDIAIVFGGMSWGYALIVKHIEGTAAAVAAIGIAVLSLARAYYFIKERRDGRRREDNENLPDL